jgi:NADPH:quinone reductase-like Zn-dependent oxidoreductase
LLLRKKRRPNFSESSQRMNQVIEIFELKHGGTRLTERELPLLQPDEVRVKMEAFSLNHRDLVVARKNLNRKFPLPRIPLSDGVGVVSEIGAAAVTTLSLGERVASAFWPHWLGGAFGGIKTSVALGGSSHDGVLQTYWQAHAHSVVRVPAYLTANEAACLPCAGVTAWTSLKRARPGDRVLVHGSGSVALFAIQFSKAMGLHVTVTSRSPLKRSTLEQIGADRVHCYEGLDWLRGLADEKFNLIVDPVGGQTFAASLNVMCDGGSIITLGHLGGGNCQVNTNLIWERGLTVGSATVGSVDDFDDMNRALDAWRIRPVIANTRPWLEFEQALDDLAAGTHVGKLVLTV